MPGKALLPGEVTAADLAARVRAGGVETLDVHTAEEIARPLGPTCTPATYW